MAPREREHGSTLSARRAFVGHFGAGGGPARRRFSGRVEPLSSGESTRVTSLKALLAFFTTAPGAASLLPPLDGTQPGAPLSRPALREHREANRP